MKTKQIMNLALISGMLLTTGCSDDQNTEVIENNEPVELQISPMVTMTRSVIQGGEQTGADANDLMKHVAVYAVDKSGTTDYTAAKSNNYALYTRAYSGSTTWTSGDDKIFLTNSLATVYAYHPAYTPGNTNQDMQTSGTALKATGTGANMTIPVTVFQGTDGTTTIAVIDNADKKWNGSNAWTDNDEAAKKKIASAAGEVDYMYATPLDDVSNGHSSSATSVESAYKKELTMNHALSLLSFRVYNDGTYENTGSLTKIELKDGKASGSVLSKATSCTMKIADGTIAGRSTNSDESDDATFARAITGYTLITVGATDSQTTVATGSTANEAAAAASKKISILVLPTTTISSNDVKATFTIDAATYEISLPTTPNAWVKGTSYLYTVKLSGAGLSITKVTVTDWSTGTGGDIAIQ